MVISLLDSQTYLVDLGQLNSFRQQLVELLTKPGYTVFCHDWLGDYWYLQTIMYQLSKLSAKHLPIDWQHSLWKDYDAGLAPNVVDTKVIFDELHKDKKVQSLFNEYVAKFAPLVREIIGYIFGYNIFKNCHGHGCAWDLQTDLNFGIRNVLSDQEKFYAAFDGICH